MRSFVLFLVLTSATEAFWSSLDIINKVQEATQENATTGLFSVLETLTRVLTDQGVLDVDPARGLQKDQEKLDQELEQAQDQDRMVSELEQEQGESSTQDPEADQQRHQTTGLLASDQSEKRSMSEVEDEQQVQEEVLTDIQEDVLAQLHDSSENVNMNMTITRTNSEAGIVPKPRWIRSKVRSRQRLPFATGDFDVDLNEDEHAMTTRTTTTKSRQKTAKKRKQLRPPPGDFAMVSAVPTVMPAATTPQGILSAVISTLLGPGTRE